MSENEFDSYKTDPILKGCMLLVGLMALAALGMAFVSMLTS